MPNKKKLVVDVEPVVGNEDIKNTLLLRIASALERLAKVSEDYNEAQRRSGKEGWR